MRRTWVVVSVMLVLVLFGGRVFAVELYANGQRLDAHPGVVLEEGRSYGPLRAVAEAVGGTVEWMAEEKAAVICLGNLCVKVKASEGLVREGRVLLPLRKLAETLGATVTWVADEQRVNIDMPAR